MLQMEGARHLARARRLTLTPLTQMATKIKILNRFT